MCAVMFIDNCDAQLQATPYPNPMHTPAVLVAEIEVRQQQQHRDDVHVELLCFIQLPHSDFTHSYYVTAIAVSECGEWRAPRFIVQNY
jgi:hypothetical protein